MFGMNKGGGAGSGQGPRGHVKGYGFRSDAPRIVQFVAPASAEPATPDSPSAAPPETLLFIVPILDGDSYDPLSPFFEYRVIDIDHATGTRIHLLDIGDPVKSGDVFKALQTPDAREADEHAGQEFAETVHAAGRTDNHRLREMNRLAGLLRISVEDLPCFVFLRPEVASPLRVLSIQREWYASGVARAAFGGLLKRWLRELRLDGPVPAGTDGDRLGRLLDRAIEDFTHRMNDAIASSTEAEGTNTFQRQGDAWRLVYEGKLAHARHSRGMEYLRALLERPGSDIPALVLRLAGTGMEDTLTVTGGTLIDERAREQFRSRLEKIEEEMEAARSAGNLDKVEDLEDEGLRISKTLGASTGLDGRLRNAPDDAERARKAVWAAIERAIGAIREVHPELGHHLDRSVTRGSSLCYRPDRRGPWSL